MTSVSEVGTNGAGAVAIERASLSVPTEGADSIANGKECLLLLATKTYFLAASSHGKKVRKTKRSPSSTP